MRKKYQIAYQLRHHPKTAVPKAAAAFVNQSGNLMVCKVFVYWFTCGHFGNGRFGNGLSGT